MKGLPCISGANKANEKEPIKIARNTLITSPGVDSLRFIRVVPNEKARGVLLAY